MKGKTIKENKDMCQIKNELNNLNIGIQKKALKIEEEKL